MAILNSLPTTRINHPETFRLMTRFWKYLETICPTNMDELADLRGYERGSHTFYTNPPELVYCDTETNPELAKALVGAPSILALTDQEPNSANKGEFLLDKRWVTPVKLPDGTVTALVGWRPGMGAKMKYLTTPTPGFSKKHLLLGAHRLINNPTPIVFVVEGVFDQMALNSLGVPAVSVMGKVCSPYQLEQLNRLPCKVVGIPDRDAYDVIQYDKWGLKQYFTWNNTIPGKDMDDLIKIAGDSVRDTLLGVATHSDYLIRIGAAA